MRFESCAAHRLPPGASHSPDGPLSTRSFDPATPGAKRLAATWAPQRERWLVRRAVIVQQDGTPIDYETVEVAAPIGRQLVADGAELLSTRVISAHD